MGEQGEEIHGVHAPAAEVARVGVAPTAEQREEVDGAELESEPFEKLWYPSQRRAASNGHSMLLDYMKNSPPSLRKLKEAGYCGDMLWRPLGPDGPIEIETQIRAMTLIELSHLRDFIQQGKPVLSLPKTPYT